MRGDIGLDLSQLHLHRIVGVLQPADAAKDLAEVQRVHVDAGTLKQLLAVADGVERGGTRADGADSAVAQALDHAANGSEPRQIPGEFGAIERFGMQRRQRIRNFVLRQIVAGAHLAAEAIAPHGDGHVVGAIGRGLDEHGYVQAGGPQRLHLAALFTKIGQRDDDAVDLVAVAVKQLRALAGIRTGFHSTVLRVFRGENHYAVAGGFQHADDFLTAGLGQVIREEAAIADDDAKGLFSRHRYYSFPGANFQQ